MILLADGGSTSVAWSLTDNGKLIASLTTSGANPFFRSREDISAELKKDLLPKLANYKITDVYFYGAGCAFPDKNEIIEKAIADNIKADNIFVGSDLLGAAKALCGNKPGIACIIGTGSNSCYYDGKNIVENVSPLGYILGDEGSGAVLGRLLVGACLKNQLTKGLKEKFLDQYKLKSAEIIDRVYRQEKPNTFLASLSQFLLENIEDKTIYNLVYNAFTDFFKKNVMQYDYKKHEVHFTGSVAFYYADVLRDVAKDLDIKIGQIIAEPMEGLIANFSK